MPHKAPPEKKNTPQTTSQKSGDGTRSFLSLSRPFSPPPAAPPPVNRLHSIAAGTQGLLGGVAVLPGEYIRKEAGRGVRGRGSSLPFLDRIQRSFGQRHNLSSIKAHVGGAAADASSRIGAEAYAMGEHVAFQSAPDLHTAAHEAAHVVQQRSGVRIAGGVGQVGDPHEWQADAIAERVVQGASSESLLDGYAPPSSALAPHLAGTASASGAGATVQRKITYKMGNIKNREELVSALCKDFDSAHHQAIENEIIAIESWKRRTVSGKWAYENISELGNRRGWTRTYVAPKISKKHGPQFPEKVAESVSADHASVGNTFFFSTVTLARADLIDISGSEEVPLVTFTARNDSDSGAHAEDGLVRQINTYLANQNNNNKQSLLPSQMKLRITINNSPCGSDKRNCAKMLSDYQNEKQFGIFHLYFMSPYGSGNTRKTAFQTLQNAKIQVSQYKPMHLGINQSVQSKETNEKIKKRNLEPTITDITLDKFSDDEQDDGKAKGKSKNKNKKSADISHNNNNNDNDNNNSGIDKRPNLKPKAAKKLAAKNKANKSKGTSRSKLGQKNVSSEFIEKVVSKQTQKGRRLSKRSQSQQDVSLDVNIENNNNNNNNNNNEIDKEEPQKPKGRPGRPRKTQSVSLVIDETPQQKKQRKKSGAKIMKKAVRSSERIKNKKQQGPKQGKKS